MTDPHRLRDALAISARLVATYGETFLPVFLRLEAEAARIDLAASAMDRARAITDRQRAQGGPRAA